jgi:hypothetical protein
MYSVVFSFFPFFHISEGLFFSFPSNPDDEPERTNVRKQEEILVQLDSNSSIPKQDHLCSDNVQTEKACLEKENNKGKKRKKTPVANAWPHPPPSLKVFCSGCFICRSPNPRYVRLF